MTIPLASLSSALGSRLLAGVGTLVLLAAIGLFASRPARTAGGPVPVTVANAPLAVSSTDASAKEPVEGFITVISNSSISAENLLYTVPAGKRLVVESMTLSSNGISNTIGYTAAVLNQKPDGTLISLSSLNAPSGVGAVAAATQPMRLHVEPGDKVAVSVFRAGTGPFVALVSLSGYLVDAP